MNRHDLHLQCSSETKGRDSVTTEISYTYDKTSNLKNHQLHFQNRCGRCLEAQMITTNMMSNLITQTYQVAFKTLIGMITGAALGAIDSYLGGNDLQQIQEDALKGMLFGGVFGGTASIFAGFVKAYSTLKTLLKIEPIAGVILGYFGIKDSLDNGHGVQAIFRAMLTFPSIVRSAGVIKDIKLPEILKNNRGFWDLSASRGKGGKFLTELKEIFNSIKDSPNYPKGFQPRVNGTLSNKVNNRQLLEKLREIESGTWKKYIKMGMMLMEIKYQIIIFRVSQVKCLMLK